jgi:pimeloyl-ACP methyl ester carboxylesterase
MMDGTLQNESVLLKPEVSQSYIRVGQENSCGIDLYYEDHGSGPPVVLIHGWPLSGRSWEKQLPALIDGGYRVITYDRRGFGESSRPAIGYDYDTLAADLDKIIRELDLEDVVLVGFSMGGGEVARYLGTYGVQRVKKAVFISAVPPFLLKTNENPDGVDDVVFRGIQKALKADRLDFLSEFLSDFYNFDTLEGPRVSRDVIRLSWNVAAQASPIGTLACVQSWLTDFRGDLAKIQIPTLVIHGDSDRILPLEATGQRTHEMIPGSRLVVIEGGPHGSTWTHADLVNRILLEFLNGA